VANGKVFVATANCHLVALDAVTGKSLWDKAFCDVRAGESATVAPLVVKNLVIVGNSVYWATMFCTKRDFLSTGIGPEI
jgi:alcohol dehydrogenase (cytochrome c)